MIPMGGYCGLCIELKRLGGKNPTKEQVKNLTMLGLVGNAVYTCQGSDAAIKILESYLAGRIPRSQPYLYPGMGSNQTTKLLRSRLWQE